ncbi:hypothetical protein [Kocuria massiliensis]|uniref:hypothetical protein n=1 Tax=Kocuria massiliensis TaxID=1926282 RepID=UPI000A1CC6FC|nr:hypothetical protein [Kocuria massiliensis]
MSETPRDDAGPDVEGRNEHSDALHDFAQLGTEDSLDRLLDRLEETPVDEHVAVYEQLHAQIRKMLDRDPSSLPEGLIPRANRQTESAESQSRES